MKFTFVLLALFGLQFLLSIAGLVDSSFNLITTWLVDPSTIETSPYIVWVQAALLFVAGAGIFIGNLVKMDIIVFAGLTSFFLSEGFWLVGFWTYMAGQFGSVLATLFVSPIIIITIMAVLEWWRKGE